MLRRLIGEDMHLAWLPGRNLGPVNMDPSQLDQILANLFVNARDAGDLHLLMTDVVMPEMNGRNLARNLLSLYPKLKCLFMSGYTATVIAHQGVLDKGVHFIQKPFSINDLAAKIREALDQ